jgi:thiol-disulfide isomerase/thioredoxin
MPSIKWKDSKVKRLRSTEQIDRLLKEGGPHMVVIYADWCPHCRDAEPVLTDLASKVDGKATVYAIDESDYTGDAAHGYPTIKIVKGGVATDYGGERDSSAMQKALLGGSLGGKRSRRGRTRRFINRRRKTHRTSR